VTLQVRANAAPGNLFCGANKKTSAPPLVQLAPFSKFFGHQERRKWRRRMISGNIVIIGAILSLILAISALWVNDEESPA